MRRPTQTTDNLPITDGIGVNGGGRDGVVADDSAGGGVGGGDRAVEEGVVEVKVVVAQRSEEVVDAHGNALTLMLMAFLILNPAWASSLRRAGLVWRVLAQAADPESGKITGGRSSNYRCGLTQVGPPLPALPTALPPTPRSARCPGTQRHPILSLPSFCPYPSQPARVLYSRTITPSLSRPHRHPLNLPQTASPPPPFPNAQVPSLPRHLPSLPPTPPSASAS